MRKDLQHPQTGKSLSHTSYTNDILQYIDILVDGEYQDAKRNICLEFRGSENQRIIDVQKSIGQQEPVLSSYMKIKIT